MFQQQHAKQHMQLPSVQIKPPSNKQMQHMKGSIKMQQGVANQNMKQDEKHNIQQQNFQAPQQFTKQNIDIAKDTQKLSDDQQRISQIHSRLHKEAEKVHQWKNDKEMELKQKEKQLSDALRTIDTMRKSILELQFQNEQCCTSLQERELEKQETDHKIITCREMADVLRGQMNDLEKRVMIGERDKQDLMTENQKRIADAQELVLKFQELDIQQAATLEKHKITISNITADYNEQVNELSGNIRHFENQIVTLVTLKRQQEEDITKYKATLQENEKNLDELQTNFKDGCLRLKKAEEEIQDKDHVINVTNQKLTEVEQDLALKIQLFDEINGKYKECSEEEKATKKHLEEVMEIYSKEIACLQNDVSSLKETVDIKDEQIRKISAEIVLKEQEIEQLTDTLTQKDLSNNKLSDEMISCQSTLDSVQESNRIASDQLAEAEKSMREKQEENMKLTEKKNELINNLSNLNDQLELLSSEKNVLELQLQELNDVLKQLKDRSAQSDQQIEELTCELNETKSYLAESKESAAHLQSALEEREKLSEELKQGSEMTNTNNASLKKELLDNNQKICELMEEKNLLETSLSDLKIENRNQNEKLIEKEKEQNDLQVAFNEMKIQNTNQTEKLIENENEKNSLNAGLDCLKSETKIQKENLCKKETELTELKALLQEKEDELSIVAEQEQEQKTNLQSELADKEKVADDLNSKTKSLQSQIATKTKQIKNLEKENATFKKQLKTRDDKLTKIEEQLNEVNAQYIQEEQAKTTAFAENATLTEQLQEKSTELEGAKLNNQELQQAMEIAVKERADAVALASTKQKQFVAELNSYQADNDREVNEKLEVFKQKELKAADCLKESEKRCESLSVQVEKLETLLMNKQSKDDDLTSKMEAICTENNEKLAQVNTMLQLTKDELEAKQSDLDAEKLKNQDLEVKLREQKEDLEKAQYQQLRSPLQTKQLKQVSPSHHHDRIVPSIPTTPKTPAAPCLSATTPSSVIRNSQSSRGKRVLFAGVEKENSPMEVDHEEKTGSRQNLLTTKRKMANVRFSPKPSPSVVRQHEDEDKRELEREYKLTRIERNKSPAISQSHSISDLMSGHKLAANKSPKLQNRADSMKLPKSSSVEKNKKNKNVFSKKPSSKSIKKKHETEEMAWFDADNVFGFDG